MSKGTTVFVVEGAAREVQWVGKIADRFFAGKNHIEICCLPANGNIYVLWNMLKADDFETDIIELIREKIPNAAKALNGIKRQDIDEVYLFFDYDAQQRNLPKGVDAVDVIKQMLCTFNNETLNGKLYLSYPMVEALRDHIPNTCKSLSDCVVNFADFKNYKALSHNSACNLDDGEIWKCIMQSFVTRLNCLFDRQSIDFETYKKQISPTEIFSKQFCKYISQNKIFVLSAFPEFLFDYYQIKFWKSFAKNQRPIKNCKHK